MKIADVVCSVGRSGFVNRDLAAIKAGARATKIVQPGTSISVMLVLGDRQVAFGDYSM
jgi:methylaspartate ammonia-lyase